MNKRSKALYDSLSRFEANRDKPKEKIVNLETVRFQIGTFILEVASGLKGKITDVDEYKGIGIVPTNRGSQYENTTLYSSESDFEMRISKGFLQISIEQ